MRYWRRKQKYVAGGLEVNGTAVEGGASLENVTASSTELNYMDGSPLTPGTVAASKAVVVDANKDIGTFRDIGGRDFAGRNIDAGASGTAGSVDVFPTTTSKGKTSLTAADNAGDTTTSITTAAQAGARTYTVPDAGASCNFQMGRETVEAHTTGDTLAAGESGSNHTNAGASGTVALVLPAAVAGLRFRFYVLAAQALRIDPNGTETISGTDGAQGAAGKYIGADAVGEFIEVVCLTAGQWEIVASRGTWTHEG